MKVVPVTQSAYMQKNKLKYLLEKVDHLFEISEADRLSKWTITSEYESIASQDLHCIIL